MVVICFNSWARIVTDGLGGILGSIPGGTLVTESVITVVCDRVLIFLANLVNVDTTAKLSVSVLILPRILVTVPVVTMVSVIGLIFAASFVGVEAIDIDSADNGERILVA